MATYPTTTGSTGEMPHVDALRGVEVCDVDRNKIGTVEGIYTEGDRGTVRYLAVKTGWFGTKQHVVPLDDVSYHAEENIILLPYGRDQLESAPTYDEVPGLGDADEESIYRHYGRPGYWEAVRARQTTPSPTPEIARADVAEAMERGGDGLRDDTPGMEKRVGDGPIGRESGDGPRIGSRGVRRHTWD